VSTKYVDITGKALWAKVWPGQIDREYEDERRGGNNSIAVIVDKDMLKLFNALGSKAKPKSIEDLQDDREAKGKERIPELEDFLDKKFITLRRYERLGNGTPLSPLAVVGVDVGTAIGNLSDVTATVEVYNTEYKGKPIVGIRLVRVRVDNLVPFVPTQKEAVNAHEDAPPVH
jgi:hypothetical protein